MRTKDYVTDLISWDDADASLKAAIAPSLFQILIETGRDAMLAIGMQPGEYDPFTPAIREYQDARTTKIGRQR
jgi:hypothetical protein